MAAPEGAVYAEIPWAEVKLYIADVITMYESRESEQKSLSAIKQLKLDIDSLTASAEADVKSLITEMQSRIASVDAEAGSAMPSIDDVRAQLQALEARKAKLAEEAMRLRAAKDSSQGALHSLTQQIAAIKQAKATLNTDHGAAVPRVKHSLSLYASISSIRWDYDSGAVAGYIAPPNGAPVKPFHFDPRIMSDKAVADALWSTIGECYGLN